MEFKDIWLPIILGIASNVICAVIPKLIAKIKSYSNGATDNSGDLVKFFCNLSFLLIFVFFSVLASGIAQLLMLAIAALSGFFTISAFLSVYKELNKLSKKTDDNL